MSSPGTDTVLAEQEVEPGEPLLEMRNLTKHFSNTSGLLGGFGLERDGLRLSVTRDTDRVQAVDDVSFTVPKGQTVGLVGESGCGKSTLARTVLRLIEPTDGNILYKGTDITELSGEELRSIRKDVQIIFQDPQSSLDPRMKVGPIVEEPMRAHDMYDREGREERARELLEKVGLDPQHYNRYPHEFSGGQRQRVNLARALSVDPEFIVCDEPTSALDVSIQAQVLNTMRELQAELGLTYLFISHDLSVIRHISDRVAVMYLGQLAEEAGKEELFENPKHPYTQALLSSIPNPDPRSSESRGVLRGDVPSPIDPPSGCRFRTRCPELIAPAHLELGDAEWERIRTFLRAVDRRTFDDTDTDAIRKQFFGGTFPTGEAGNAVDAAIDYLHEERWEDATTLLQQTFTEPSICATEVPSYEVEPEYGDSRHFAACHLNAPADGES
jgi:peptide/nickel transport system ATP-binding protein